MRTGAFQLVLQMVQPTLRNSTVKVFVMLVSFSAIDMWAYKVDVIDTTALTIAIVGTIGCILCHRFVVRRDGSVPLRELYVVRVIMAVSPYAMVVSVFGVLHDFLSSFDRRFLVSLNVLAVVLAAALVIALVSFWVSLRPRIRNFGAHIAAFTEEGRTFIRSADLDEMYVPAAARAPLGPAAITSAVAMFGAFGLVARSKLFPYPFMLVEVLVLTMFIRGCISLTYETMFVLSSGEKTRSLVVLSSDATALPCVYASR